MSVYVWDTKESKKQKAARKKEEREAEAKEAEALRENLLASSGVDLGPLPSSLAHAGKCERRLAIPDGCAGILIGKKGENLKKVEKQFKVTIRIEDENSEKDAAAGKRRTGPLKGATLQVVLSGESPGAVAAAARELDFVVEHIEVPAEMAGWAVGRGGKHLNHIRELTTVAVLNFDRGDRKKANKEKDGDQSEEEALADEGEDEEDGAKKEKPPAGPCKFEIKGQRESVADAKLCIETHLGYYPVYQEMQEDEEVVNKQILEAQGFLGRSARRPRQDGVGAGGRGAKGGGGRGRGRGSSNSEGGGAGRGGASGRGGGGRVQGGDAGRGRSTRVWSRAQKATEADAVEPGAS